MATASAIAEAGKELEPIAKRLGLMGYGNKYAKQDDWREHVQRIVHLARSNAMDRTTLIKAGDSSWASLEALLGKAHTKVMGDGMDGRLKGAVAKAVIAMKSNTDDATKATTGALNFLYKIQNKMRYGMQYVTWEDWLGLAGLTTGAKSKELVEDVQAVASEHLKHPSFRYDLETMIKGVFSCAAEASEQYANYKREQGLMDFVDQEALVLDMASNNTSFRASMKERVKLLMVDEFQDTSPIQLALFLKLSELAEEVIWVGDQKQSIYGFRGADPVLMDAVSEEIEKGLDASSPNHILKESWRSKQELVEFCNSVFSPVFHHMNEEKVCLDIPNARKEVAVGGWIENWALEGSNAEKRSAALVTGVQELLETHSNIQAGDIAILCRSNNECEDVSAALKAKGIRASIAEGDLLATQECTLALAALRFMLDEHDSIALAEIVCFSHLHQSHDGWLRALLNDSKITQEIWKEDEFIQALVGAKNRSMYLTPLEALELAMSCIDIERSVYAWGDVEQRLSNLDQLRTACLEYQDRCRSRRDSATVSGFLTWLFGESDLKQAKSAGEDTVNVLTYHKSKGLEWPVVIMHSLNKASRSGVFGVSVVEAENFVADQPLVGRSLRYWPWCYGTKKKADAFNAYLEVSDIASKAKAYSLSESQRVLYVGLSRARDGLVLVQQKNKKNIESKWLDELINAEAKPVLNIEAGKLLVQARDGQVHEFPSLTRELMGRDETYDLCSDDVCYLPERKESVIYPTSRIAPSGVEWTDLGEGGDREVQVSLDAMLGEHIDVHSVKDRSSFGNAVHGFLGADIGGNQKERLDHAAQILSDWEEQASIVAEDMLVMSDRLKAYIRENYANATVMTEWPLMMKMETNQQMQGWLDMLLELPDGYVVIDHKTYSGGDVNEHAKEYAPQLAVYKRAVELATGKPVLKTLIHMPITGCILDVKTS